MPTLIAFVIQAIAMGLVARKSRNSTGVIWAAAALALSIGSALLFDRTMIHEQSGIAEAITWHVVALGFSTFTTLAALFVIPVAAMGSLPAGSANATSAASPAPAAVAKERLMPTSRLAGFQCMRCGTWRMIGDDGSPGITCQQCGAAAVRRG
jgi:ribosomal protein S27E